MFPFVELDIDNKRKADIVADICKWSYKYIYDVIVLAEVLEHVHAPHKAIENIWQSLKLNCKITITEPFIFPTHDKPYDYYRYTKCGLKHLLNKFSDIKVVGRNSWTETLLVLLISTIRNENKRLHALSFVFVITAYTSFPFLLLIGKLLPSGFITSGYFVTAIKR